MTPERESRLLRAVVRSLGTFVDEAEKIEKEHPGVAVHLVLTMKQARLSLEQLLDQDSESG